MAGILKSCSSRWKDSRISVLIVGPAELCELLSAGLHDSAKRRQWKISVHLGESIVEVLRFDIKLGVDFIIFAFDGRVIQSLLEVETNIKFIDDYYIFSGASCMVNCTGVLNVMGLTFHKLSELQNKYKIQFLSVNVVNKEACLKLGSKILNLTEGVLGITSGVPIPILESYKN